MTSWQKRLRIGLAIFGIVFAGLVYRSIGERPAVTPPEPPERLDKKALLETRQTVVEQVRGNEREFEIKSSRTLSYEDGSAKHIDVVITRRTEGRVFVITAKEAQAGPKQIDLELSGGVKVSVSDGFELMTERATFNQSESIARVPNEVTFKKGLMSGSGLGATYDQRNDVLTLSNRAKVVVTEQDGRISLDGSAGSATLDRMQNVLFMKSSVHVLRGSQVIDADEVMARLSANEDVITFLELRGNASVQGGDGALDTMKANAIDLDYTDDGEVLERVLLNGKASVTTAADEHASSRQMSGEGLDVEMGPDGGLARVTGRDGVQLDIPKADGAPPRNIRARTLDATGEAGRGITAVRFRNDVVFQESGAAGASGREVRATSLQASFDGDTLRNAFFDGGVTFKERGFEAEASAAQYQPVKNTLNLTSEGRQRSIVTDDQIHVDAREIDVTLEGHGMAASGNVRTTLSGRSSKSKDRDGGGRLPGLLKEGQPASINAGRLNYSGGNGRAEYSGDATLVQGDTAIRGDLIVLDQEKGDLVASGSARSSLSLDKGRTDGRAKEIRYDEAKRTVAYSSAAVAPKNGQAGSATLAQVSGPDGDLRGERIEVVLASGDNAVERLEAYNRVTMVVGARTANGERLTYHAREERYVMSGAGVTPVSIRESCQETTGRTLTFFKSTDRIIVDGNETRRTETRPCTAPLTGQPQPPSPATR
jgi:LPS export ABC transporter protein LptC/lipopolysaccharide transport protein LptA